MSDPAQAPKRQNTVTVYKAGDGWRYRVRAGNYKVIDASEEAFRSRRYAVKRARQRWPEAVITIELPR